MALEDDLMPEELDVSPQFSVKKETDEEEQ